MEWVKPRESAAGIHASRKERSTSPENKKEVTKMFSKQQKKRVITAVLILVCCIPGFLFVSRLTAQQEAVPEVKKEYVSILPGGKAGALPRIKVSSLTFNAGAKAGDIPVEVEPLGFWKSKTLVEKTSYDFFEFDVEEPASLIEVGEPNIPVQVIEVDIPPDAQFDRVIMKSQLLKTLDNVMLAPNQKPLPVDQEFVLEKPALAMNQAIYKQPNPYPGKFYEVVATGFYGDRQVVILRTFPVQYQPALKQVKFYKLTGVIKFKAKSIQRAATARAVLSPEDKKLGLTVHNLGDAQKWKPLERVLEPSLVKEVDAMHAALEMKTIGTIPCLIICADLFYCPAKELAAYYIGKGKQTVVMRVKNIDAFVAGKDTADKMRNYIRLLYRLYQTRWVILFGDVVGSDTLFITHVPTRMAVDPAPYDSIDDGWIPCDYYFSCLDGTWDANGNHKYGEIVDLPDLLPEVAVGRLPTNTLDDAYKIVNRIKAYSPPAQRIALLAANDLGWGGHEITFKENTYKPILIGFFSTIYRLYQGWGTLTLATFADHINNRGVGFVEYYGHGSPTSTQLMTKEQVKMAIDITPAFLVQFSLSCSTSRYDNQECYGEAWVECTRASSYIGSTRVAYGSSSTGEGIDTRFINRYRLIWNTGCSLTMAKKQHFIDYGWNRYAIKSILEFTLLGDPFMNH